MAHVSRRIRDRNLGILDQHERVRPLSHPSRSSPSCIYLRDKTKCSEGEGTIEGMYCRSSVSHGTHTLFADGRGPGGGVVMDRGDSDPPAAATTSSTSSPSNVTAPLVQQMVKAGQFLRTSSGILNERLFMSASSCGHAHSLLCRQQSAGKLDRVTRIDQLSVVAVQIF